MPLTGSLCLYHSKLCLCESQYTLTPLVAAPPENIHACRHVQRDTERAKNSGYMHTLINHMQAVSFHSSTNIELHTL